MSFGKFVVTLAAVAFVGTGWLGALTIRDVSVRSFEDAQMLTLGEYFGGQEHTGRRTYLRTYPEGRSGVYLIADFDKPVSSLPKGAVLVLDLVRGDDGAAERITLPFSEAKGYRGRALYIGLTDDAHAHLHLLAWRISVQSADGKELVSKESFLWSMPDSSGQKK